MRRWPLLLAALALAACSNTRASSAGDAGTCDCSPPGDGGTGAAATAQIFKPGRLEPTAHAPHVEPLAPCEAKGELPLAAAQRAYDEKRFETALSCAAQAAALEPSNVLAYAEKANALTALDRRDEAKQAYARALAMEPDSLDALLGAAYLYAVVLPSSRENDELGSIYAEHGFEVALGAGVFDVAEDFARYSAMALNDIGMPREAIDRADWVLARAKDDPEASFEKATALFELCRLDDAAKVFEKLSKDGDRGAHAHHYLGLILERTASEARARAHFDAARKLSPEDFPAPVPIAFEAFRKEVAAAVEGLPEDMRRDLKGITVSAADLPALDDLVANDPPLSPNILGLFRGPPLAEACVDEDGGTLPEPCRSVTLYRKNLARAVRSHDELLEQIRVTLLHEVGHLRGEDDYELAARGLE